ncbi:MAG TPA: FAD-dependent monooxygenase [Propionibacteriaceae bacterium]|nr:FAD-dependent monooxygenase [Propionibacteriaceae bacterium]
MERVVVIGGSLTGLFAAAAMAGQGRSVTIVERDVFPATAMPRAGVPQGGQAHVLLFRGLSAAEQLLPGLREDLLRAGAVGVNGGHLLWLSALGWMPESDHGYEVVSATRPLLEHVVRQRTLALDGVTSLQGSRVTGLRREGDQWQVQRADHTAVMADLVLDASGRNSRLPTWLEELGVSVPEPERLDAQVGYATRRYRARTDALAGCAGVVVAATPELPRGALALPAEDNQWLLSVVGFGASRPPRDNEGFERYLHELVDPAVADLAEHCEPIGDVQVHRQTANVRHRYEKARHWPAGLVAVGDALCAFDPVYGQGITVGVLQALALRKAVRRGLSPADSGHLQRRVAATVEIPWSIATGADSAFVPGGQSSLQVVLGRWTEELARLAIHGNQRANHSMSRVYNLMGPPALLLHPALFLAVARARLLGYGKATTRPRLLSQLADGPLAREAPEPVAAERRVSRAPASGRRGGGHACPSESEEEHGGISAMREAEDQLA